MIILSSSRVRRYLLGEQVFSWTANYLKKKQIHHVYIVNRILTKVKEVNRRIENLNSKENKGLMCEVVTTYNTND